MASQATRDDTDVAVSVVVYTTLDNVCDIMVFVCISHKKTSSKIQGLL